MEPEDTTLRNALAASLALNGQLGQALEECILLLTGRLEGTDEMARRHIQAISAYRSMRNTLSSSGDVSNN